MCPCTNLWLHISHVVVVPQPHMRVSEEPKPVQRLLAARKAAVNLHTATHQHNMQYVKLFVDKLQAALCAEADRQSCCTRLLVCTDGRWQVSNVQVAPSVSATTVLGDTCLSITLCDAACTRTHCLTCTQCTASRVSS